MQSQSLPYARSFRELRVYQRQRELSRHIFAISKTFPPEERYSLTDQIRRAARSIGAQIAEAWAKRRYEKHFVSKLTDADAEQMETQHWVETASDDGYLATETCTRLVAICEEIGRMLSSMIENASSFCGDPFALREEPAGYFVSPPILQPDPGPDTEY